MGKLTVYQQNLHKSLLPKIEVLNNFGLHLEGDDGGNIKLLCTQEPNIWHNKVNGFGTINNIFTHKNLQSDDDSGGRIRAATITNSKNSYMVYYGLSKICLIKIPYSNSSFSANLDMQINNEHYSLPVNLSQFHDSNVNCG